MVIEQQFYVFFYFNYDWTKPFTVPSNPRCISHIMMSGARSLHLVRSMQAIATRSGSFQIMPSGHKWPKSWPNAAATRQQIGPFWDLEWFWDTLYQMIPNLYQSMPYTSMKFTMSHTSNRTIPNPTQPKVCVAWGIPLVAPCAMFSPAVSTVGAVMTPRHGYFFGGSDRHTIHIPSLLLYRLFMFIHIIDMYSFLSFFLFFFLSLYIKYLLCCI